MTIATATALRAISRRIDDPTSTGRVLDELLAARTTPPALLALGEPTHGIAAFPLLRNDILAQLVELGYRSIALEVDFFAASVADDYVNGSAADLDTVLATGLSHGFGRIPGNRELLEWLREYNAGRAPADRVRFYGFDAPVEYSGAPSPRHALSALADFLPEALLPASVHDLDGLLGEDADWTNAAAMFDPSASIGDSERARTLRLIAGDLADALHRAAPALRAADPSGYAEAVTHARTARGLLRYHAAMASPGPDRMGGLSSARTDMMAQNLLAIAAQEQDRGPTLVFSHNAHLNPRVAVDAEEPGWSNAGALVAFSLGERYLFVASDASPHSTPGTLQGLLSEATNGRALFPADALRAALPPGIGSSEPIVRGHFPLTLADLDGADAVIFIADTDGVQHQYW
ncbi:erythromycin esterase family protein [Nocardia tengchongensis]|uniref:erythromycin esterase family protein n=1 Tax=Nocardia tengchongensis TaxID=2055889 RepID=UPI0036943530